MNLRLRERPPVYCTVGDTGPTWLAPLWREPIEPVAQACCCPAPAAYAVVVAPTPHLPNPPEILLCAHHMWQARERLSKPDVGVYDAGGHIVDLSAGPTAVFGPVAERQLTG